MANILITIGSAPAGDVDALELALAMAAFDHEVAIAFHGDGVFWLLPQQSPRFEGGKTPQKLIAAMPMYDIETLMAVAPPKQLSEQLPNSIETITATQLADHIRNADTCLSF